GTGPMAAPRLSDVSRAAAPTPITSVRQHGADGASRPRRPAAAAARRTAPARQAPPRERMRQRRTNVLFLLVAVTAGTGFLALTTRNSVMVYAAVLAA